MNKVEEFPPEVIRELKYYVYRLLDPRNGETFYVGKGKGNRVFTHARGDKETAASDDEEQRDEKYGRIREIVASRFEVQHVIHRHGMEEDTALAVEAALIEAYPGLTNVVGGHGSSTYGVAHVDEIVGLYAVDEVVIEHKILAITVNWGITKFNPYDAARFAWRINVDRARNVEYVFAVVRGIVLDVFTVEEWRRATLENFPEFVGKHRDEPSRFGFIGQQAPEDIRSAYVGKRMPEKKKGTMSAFLYYNP